MNEIKAKQMAYEKSQRMMRLKKHFEASRQSFSSIEKLTVLAQTIEYTKDPSKNPQYPLQLISQLVDFSIYQKEPNPISREQLLYDIMDISCAINLTRLFDSMSASMAERFLKLLFDPHLDDRLQLSAYCIMSNILIDFKDQERLLVLMKVLSIREQLPGFLNQNHSEGYKVVFLVVLLHMANKRLIQPTDPELIRFVQRLDCEKLSKVMSVDVMRLATIVALADDALSLKILSTLPNTIKYAISCFNSDERLEDTTIICCLRLLLTILGSIEDREQARELVEKELKFKNVIPLLGYSTDVQATALSFLLNAMIATELIDECRVLVDLWPELYRNLTDATYVSNAKVKLEAVDCLLCLICLSSPELIEMQNPDTDALLQAIGDLLKWDNTDISLETIELLCTLLRKLPRLEATIWRNSQLHDELHRVSNSKNLKLAECASDAMDMYFQPRIRNG